MTRGKHASSVVRQLRDEHQEAMESARRREHDLLERLARAERHAARADGLQEACDRLERLVQDGASPELRRVADQLERAQEHMRLGAEAVQRIQRARRQR